MQTKISEIGQIAITVSDVKQAMVFYRDVLKLDFLFSPSDELAFFQCGPTRIMLSTPLGAGEIGKNSLIYFKVESIDAFYEAVIQQGATPEREPQFAAPMPDHELWIGFVRDPDGNLVGIMEEKRSN